MSAGEIPGGPLRSRLLGLGRALLTNRFFGHFDGEALIGQLHIVATWKATDTNLNGEEVATL